MYILIFNGLKLLTIFLLLQTNENYLYLYIFKLDRQFDYVNYYLRNRRMRVL